MKRLLWLLVVCLVLSGCRMTLLPDPTQEVVYETFGTKPVEEDSALNLIYVAALDALRSGEFAHSRELFLSLGDFKDTAAYLERFIFLEDVLLCKDIWNDTDGVSGGSVEYLYDGRGRVAQENHITPDGGVNRITIQDDGAVLVRKSSRGEYMEYYNVTETGRTLARTQEINYMDGYNQSIVRTFSYDPDGRHTWESGTESRVQNNRSNTVSAWKGTYTYNEQGQLFSYEKEYSWGAKGSYREQYSYDEAGNLILLETVTDLPTLKESSRETYTYDENGNRLTLERLTLRDPGTSQETVWDDTVALYRWEDGKLVQETVTLGGQTTVTQYIYGEYLSYNADQEGG
jgi:hypothetical protein